MPLRLDASKLATESLAQSGRIRLGFLLQGVLSVEALRGLARRHDLTLKGFRIERAPASKLADLIAQSDAKVQEEACVLLLEALERAEESSDTDSGSVEAAASASAYRLRGQELEQARRDAARQVEQLARARKQQDELRRQVGQLHADAAQQAARIRHLEADLSAASAASAPVRSTPVELRIRELERDLETLGEAEEGLRRLLALRETRLRAAEETISELEALVPRGRRRRRTPASIDPATPTRLRVPHFRESFYRSLIGKDRSSVERATRAVFLLCAEGPSYPGLETKQIEGQPLWSVRASLKLRVYFSMRDDGDLDIMALADREDQHTMLRRLKER